MGLDNEEGDDVYPPITDHIYSPSCYGRCNCGMPKAAHRFRDAPSLVRNNIIPFPGGSSYGTGAREAMARFCRNADDSPDYERGDLILVWLWAEGFKVVPIE